MRPHRPPRWLHLPRLGSSAGCMERGMDHGQRWVKNEEKQMRSIAERSRGLGPGLLSMSPPHSGEKVTGGWNLTCSSPGVRLTN